MRAFLFCLSLLLAPASLLAQRGSVTMGAGVGVTQSDALSGGAFHVQASAPIAQITERAWVRAEALFQQGTVTGSPFSCERVKQLYCLGRTDRNRILGIGTQLRLDLTPAGRAVRLFLTPIGVGLYQRRTRSTETQGPAAICVVDGQITSCPDNPPFQSFTVQETATALGWSTGAGVDLDLFGIRTFADVRLHQLLDGRESKAGALALSAGVRF